MVKIKKILFFCSAFCVIGVLGLVLISEFSGFEEKNLCNVNVGERVKIEADCVNSKSYEGVSFFDLEKGNCSLKGVIFETLELEKGSYFVFGKIETYEGEKEIIIEKIKRKESNSQS